MAYDTPLDILDFPRATLYTQAPGSERDRATFNAGMFNNNPRFTVWTRVAEDANGKKKGKIDAGIGIVAMNMHLDLMERVFQGGPSVGNKTGTMVPNRDEATGDGAPGRHLGSDLHYGKTKDGICWVSLWDAEDESRPRIVFQFTGIDFHPFTLDGKPATESEISQIHALAWVRYLRTKFNQHDKGQTPAERAAQSEAWKARKNGGKGGGNSTFQSKPKAPVADMSFGDDIPY